MDSTFLQGLWITIMGMGLVFLALGLLVLAMMALERLFRPRAKGVMARPEALAVSLNRDKTAGISWDLITLFPLAEGGLMFRVP